MSSLANALRPRAVRQSPAVHVLGALLAAAFLGLVASSDPVAAVALGFGLVLVAASLLRPSLAIYAFCFLLYSNAVTVAVRFHGVPFALGALFPAVLFVPLWHHAVVRREGLLIVPALPWIAVFASVMCLGTVFARDPARRRCPGTSRRRRRRSRAARGRSGAPRAGRRRGATGGRRAPPGRAPPGRTARRGSARRP